MKRVVASVLAIAAVVALPRAAAAQGMQETVHKVANGGIHAPGWMGKVDPGAARNGSTINDARFAKEGDTYHVTTGPATTYWNSADKLTGNYTVSATFTEPKYMNLNDHPHPYGIVIGGNDMGTDQETYLYCEAYGDGRFIVRGFGPKAFMLNGRMGAKNAAVHVAAGKGKPVTQDIAMSVSGDKVSCSINGTEVASYPKSEVVGAGKLKSTDGVWGIRFAHNTDGIVSNVKVTRGGM
ncbi:MAG TPA: hypothetical protein VFK16_02080 [Gemmatimonadaceae bacterium]|nr:hypothetical protein [Gemmatimonadaceae bacterium]